MTYIPESTREVLFRSGIQGQQLDFTYTPPDHSAGKAQGDGSVTYGSDGAGVDAGGTTDDYAALNAALMPSGIDLAQGDWFVEIWLSPNNIGNGTTNDYVVGGISPASNTFSGKGSYAALNLSDETYEVRKNGNSITEPLNFNGGYSVPSYLAVYIDATASETKFLYEGFEAGDGVVTIKQTPKRVGQLVFTESNGATGESLKIIAARHGYVADELVF